MLKFYILIPVYNVEKYIDACLQSVLSQSYKNYEVILVDDGSTDRSGAICDEYSGKHANFTVIHKKNEGVLLARMTAVHFIKENRDTNNSYGVFLDSDDMLGERALSTMAEHIVSSQCDILLYGFRLFGNENIVFSSSEDEGEREHTLCDHSEILREALLKHLYNSIWRKAVRTELLLDGDFTSVQGVQMGEDMIQSVALYRRCKTMKVIPEELYLYRATEASLSRTIKLKKYTDDLTSKEYAVNIIKADNVWTDEDFSKYRERCILSLKRHVFEILGSNAKRNAKKLYLETLRKHPFYIDFCHEGISQKSHALLKLFDAKCFKTMMILWKLNQLKMKILGGRNAEVKH